MLLNRLWAGWQKYLYCYLSGTVLVTIESQCYSAETHCEQGPGDARSSTVIIIRTVSSTRAPSVFEGVNESILA